MGIRIEKIDAVKTVDITVLVQFMDQSLGDFKGTFIRPDQERLDELLAPDAGFTNSEVLDEVLVSVSGIGDANGEMQPADQIAWVKKTPECVSAAVAAFFKAMRPARYDEKTSRSRRSRG